MNREKLVDWLYMDGRGFGIYGLNVWSLWDSKKLAYFGTLFWNVNAMFWPVHNRHWSRTEGYQLPPIYNQFFRQYVGRLLLAPSSVCDQGLKWTGRYVAFTFQNMSQANYLLSLWILGTNNNIFQNASQCFWTMMLCQVPIIISEKYKRCTCVYGCV